MKFSGESNNWQLDMFRRGLFRTCGMFLLNVILFCSEIAQGSFKESFVGKLGDPTQTVGRTALWQNYCAETHQIPGHSLLSRRSLFCDLVSGPLCLLGIFQVPQNKN